MKRLLAAACLLVTAMLLVLAAAPAGLALPVADPLFGDVAVAAPVLLFAPELRP